VYLDGRVNQEHAPYDWQKTFEHLPILTSDEPTGRKIGFYRDWVNHPTRDSYWDANSWENAQDLVGVPALSIGGWYDIFLKGLLTDHVEITKRAKTPAARTGKRIMIGPWVHGIGRNTVGDLDFGPQALVDLTKVQLRWYDHWLKDIANGVAEDAPIRIFVMGENYWRSEREWPLARTQYTDYYLRSGGRANSVNGDGALSPGRPAAGAGKDTFTYDPATPVPTLGGSNCCWTDIVPMGPFDQRPAERRDDVLVYTTPELTEPLEITGPITMTLFASTSAKDTDFTAKLVDVHPNGYAQNIQDGIVRARYRASHQQAQFVEPGSIVEYTIDLWATSNVFLPRHRIRVEISSSNFPRFDRNLNTGELPGTATTMAKATQTIYHDAQHPSRIVLPVIPKRATDSSPPPARRQ
jgi:putative CocE/NonD family hydrolase